jgi:hypothetical protein
MATVAKPLTDQEIQSVASYLQGLHPRSEEASADQVAALKTQPAAPAAGPATTPADAKADKASTATPAQPAKQ